MAVLEFNWFATLIPDLVGADVLGSALGLTTLVRTDDAAMFQTKRGDVLEFCAPHHPASPTLFSGQSTVAGFRVLDLDESIASVRDAGFELIGNRQSAGEVHFQHFRGPDGQTYGLLQSPV